VSEEGVVWFAKADDDDTRVQSAKKRAHKVTSSEQQGFFVPPELKVPEPAFPLA
jgi:hypothetical protein